MAEEYSGNTVTLDDQRRLIVTGVAEVVSFSENEIKLETLNKKKMTISGSSLKISGFNKQSGEFRAEGQINMFKFAFKPDPIMKRLFK